MVPDLRDLEIRDLSRPPTGPVTLLVEPGQTLGLAGESASGKSSLLRAADTQAVECARHLPYNLRTRIVEWIALPAGIPVG